MLVMSAVGERTHPLGQLGARYSIKRVWARDSRYLASRLLRKVLGRTVAFLLNRRTGKLPLQLTHMLS